MGRDVFIHDWYFKPNQPWLLLIALLAVVLAAAVATLLVRMARRQE
jgi:hypothetical protein